jgi:hypothetical protein
MISLTLDDVERRFAQLGIPNRFSADERLETPDVAAGGGLDMIAFPTPHHNKGLNILELRRLCGTDPAHQPSFFDHPWYLDEAFARVNCEPGWHYLHSVVLPESISQPVHYIRNLEARGLELPSAVEVTLMLFLHFAGAREQLLQKKHTWCSDRASLNRWVTVGAFGRNGLFVSGHPPDFASRGLGICGKIKR